MKKIKVNYAEIIIRLRVKLNLTQEKLADKLGVSFATVNRWENGRTTPSRRYVYALKDLCEKEHIDWRLF